VSQPAAPSGDDPGAWLARYAELQSSLFVTLARSLGLSGPGGRDAFGDLFQIAITAAWVKERDGEPIRNPRAFLRQVIINQRKMQLRSQRRHPATSFDELAATAESSGGISAEAIADRRSSVSELVERRELAELVTTIVLTIERRAGTVWTMRYLYGCSPEDVMAALGITHRQYSRLFERATVAINRKLVAYLAGDWCPGYAWRFARLAAGRASLTDAQAARAHLSACPRCRGAYETFTRLQRGTTRPAPRHESPERLDAGAS
jgi:RNA polymerase sigma factor (sigma-70 family)